MTTSSINSATVQRVLRIGLLISGLVFLLLARPTAGQAQDDEASPVDPAPSQLVIRMQSDRFSVRQQSMVDVMANPEPSIPLIEAAIESADSDFRLRALTLLEQIALGESSSASAANLAFDTIRRISLSANDTLSRRASRSAYDILLYRQYAAALRLERLNAKIKYLPNPNKAKHPLAIHLTIDQRWKGMRSDLEAGAAIVGVVDD